jgi:competence ComEA-like helix-hairpin-helix protein
VLALTPAERRAALVVVVLLLLGAAHDAWRSTHPRETAPIPAGRGGMIGVPDVAPGIDSALGSPVGRPVPPARGAGSEAAPPAPGAGGPAATPLDLNLATVEELDALPGLGPVLARRIIEHRRLHGPFRRVEELLAVRGIGPRLLARLRPYLRLRESPGMSCVLD